MSRRTGDALEPRALNRALLARQMLLRRERAAASRAIERLVGIQAQVPGAPYLALWARLQHFRHDELTRLITARRVVRLALMRSTIHAVSARDCLELRPLVQPVIDRSLKGSFGRLLDGVDLRRLAAAARALVDETPRTLNELGEQLARRWRDRDPTALAYAARAVVPLVQVPPRGLWGQPGAPLVAAAERLLGRPLADRPSMDRMVTRYLAAFGPAGVRDAQVWSGLAGLDRVFERLRPRLRTFRDGRGRELFDVRGGPRPDADEEAPPRFLPEFDNVLLAHVDRSRIVASGYRAPLLGRGALLTGTVLIDGFVGARWNVVRAGRRAALDIETSVPLTPRERARVAEEGERLLAFAVPEADGRTIRVRRAR